MKRDGIEIDESLLNTIENTDKNLSDLLNALSKISPPPEGYKWSMGLDGKLHIYPTE